MLNPDMNSWGKCLVNTCSAKNRDRRFKAASAVNEIVALGLFQFMPDTLASAALKCISKVPTQPEFFATRVEVLSYTAANKRP